ncbi:MAG: OmpA family protein, partial [Bryobacteraceae bacterium]
MQLAKALRSAALLSVCASILAAQGLTTTATKEDWEEINFEFNSSILSDGYPSLLRLAELLHQSPTHSVTLDGNADWIGSHAYNDKLSRARAETVMNFLVKYGAGPNQISIVAHGKRQPKVSNQTREGRFMNRRVVLTVRDGQGKIVSAGGVGEAIKAMQEAQQAAQQAQAAPPRQTLCCEDILRRLDKLDEILAAIRDLRSENERLKQDVAALRQAQAGVEHQIAEQPRPPAQAELQKAMETTANAAIEKAKPSRFSLLGVNIGPSLAGVDTGSAPAYGQPSGTQQSIVPLAHAGAGSITLSGKGRYFAPFGKNETMALQAEGEVLYYRDRQEGQFDIGLVNRWDRVQAGVFSSFKHANITDIGGGNLAQAAFSADVLFSRGRIGFFGTKGFLTDAVIGRTPGALVTLPGGVISPNYNLWIEYYLRVVDQVGASAQVGLWNNAYIEGNLGALFRSSGGNKPGGTIRFVQPITDRLAFTTEASLNESLVGTNNNGRLAFGLQFGNWVRPRDFLTVKHPVPVDIPRIRYEVLTREVRTGHTPPVADAGPDQIGVPAGSITLDASASYSPEGLALSFQWTQIGGSTVVLSSANTSKATFTAAEGQTYQFRVAVTDSLGGQAMARTTITAKSVPSVQILNFSVNPAAITTGQSATLIWQVQSADTVSISPDLGTVAASGSQAVSPSQTTIYTLTAKNAKGQVTQTVTLNVNQPKLQIVDFQANPATIASGQSAMLHWQTLNADTVTISNGVGTVAPNGSTSVSPTQTTTYTLTASAQNGQSATATVTVAVNVPLPLIASFTANPMRISAGASSQLCWQVQNSSAVSISDGVGTVPPSGCQTVAPTQTTTYTLTASNTAGQTATAPVTVTVNPAPTITSFVANPATINARQSSTLTWVSQNGTRAYIDNGVGPVAASGSVQVSPAATTTYTLT